MERVVGRVLELSELTLLNVNFPTNPTEVRFTRQSVRQYDGRLERSQDPHGRDIYWFVPRPLGPADPGTDRWAIENGFVSITPLRLDLTDEAALDSLRLRFGEQGN